MNPKVNRVILSIVVFSIPLILLIIALKMNPDKSERGIANSPSLICNTQMTMLGKAWGASLFFLRTERGDDEYPTEHFFVVFPDHSDWPWIVTCKDKSNSNYSKSSTNSSSNIERFIPF